MVSAEYLAGILDGEGCILIRQDRRKRSAIVVVSVANTHRGLIDTIEQSYPGSRAQTHFRRTPKWKPAFHLTWTSKRAIAVIKAVYPFLIVKRAQADLALEFWAYSRLSDRVGGRRLTEGEVEETLRFVARSHALNKRGPDPLASPMPSRPRSNVIQLGLNVNG